MALSLTPSSSSSALRSALVALSTPRPASSLLKQCRDAWRPIANNDETHWRPFAISLPWTVSDLWGSILKAVPKKKTSYSRTRSRQLAGKGLKDVTALNTCSGCGRVKRAHLVCPHCLLAVDSIRYLMRETFGNQSQRPRLDSGKSDATKLDSNLSKMEKPGADEGADSLSPVAQAAGTKSIDSISAAELSEQSASQQVTQAEEKPRP